MSETCKVVLKKGYSARTTFNVFHWDLTGYEQIAIRYYDGNGALQVVNASELPQGTILKFTKCQMYWSRYLLEIEPPPLFPDIDYGDDT